MSEQVCKVAYLAANFDDEFHGFVRRELRALEALGIQVELFGLRPERSGSVECEEELASETSYIHPIDVSSTLRSTFSLLRKRPGSLIGSLLKASLNEETNLVQHLKLMFHGAISTKHAESLLSSGFTHIHAHGLGKPSPIAMYCSELSGIPFSISVHSRPGLTLQAMPAVRQKLREASFVRFFSPIDLGALNNYLPRKIERPVIPIEEQTEMNAVAVKLRDLFTRNSI